MKEMEKKQRGELIVGLDVGTTKICAVIGEVFEDKIDIIGIGTHPSIGLKKGVVVNIESTVHSIRKAVDQAEEMAGCEINTVCVGIAGSHIKGFNSPGIVGIKNREIRQDDINRVIDAARAVNLSQNQQIIHVLPQEFMVDDHTGIQDPLGMTGVRLVTNVHIVTGDTTSIHNLVMCCNRAGLEVADIVLESLASANAVLSREEMDLGVGLLDIGGGTSDLAIFSGNNIKHTFVLALGGNNLTNDIAIGLRAPHAEAEKIKKKYGNCLARNISSEETIEVPGMAGRESRKLSRQILGEILEPRMEEIFQLVHREIIRAGMENTIPSGIVITGGTALLEGVNEIAESIFNLPCRIGRPQGITGLVDVVNNPMYATGVGLVLYGARNQDSRKFRIRDKNIFNRIMTRMKRWFNDVV